jgi:CRP/FNR family transcriptional regulator, cyclic AMP receptor protein
MLLAAHKCLALRPGPLRAGLLQTGTEPRGWLQRTASARDSAVPLRVVPASERSTSLDEPLLDNISRESTTVSTHVEPTRIELTEAATAIREQEIDPFYLFGCYIEWERREDAGAAWELLAAGQSSNGDTRAHARALLAASRHLGGIAAAPATDGSKRKFDSKVEANMKAPYGLEIVENCSECSYTQSGFYCHFSHPILRALNQVSHKSILPAGAILFVEGQSARGVFILCSGRVNLSTTSREGKILILKTALAGEALGLSAAISGAGYEVTAETATPCQLNFVDRAHLLELLQSHSEVGLHTAQSLSRDFQSAYRDIHDLVLTRSSAGKLARLLLSQSESQSRGAESAESRIPSSMTHEEMAHRIGASRETVTRLLSDLKRKQLIRLEGPTLVIRNRTALEALAV